jgi:hypothetical protein
MTDRRSDQGFSVAPRPLGGSRRQRHPLRRLAVPIVVAIAGGLLALGWLGPRLGERPHLDVAYFGTPTPIPTLATSTPRPTAPGFRPQPTPLPAITRNDGGRLAAKVGVFGDGFRVVDLATGDATPIAQMFGGQDLVLHAPSGSGWVCLCMVDSGDADGNVTRDVLFSRVDAGGAPLESTTLVTMGTGSKRLVTIQADIDVAADGRTALVAFLEKSRTDWTYSVARLDLGSGTLGPRVGLGTATPPPLRPGAPSPTPAPDGEPSFPTIRMDLAGPTVRVAPDGRHAYVWTTEQVATDDGTGPVEVKGWRIRLDDSATGIDAAATSALDSMPMYCTTAAFVSADRFSAVCQDAPRDGSAPPRWVHVALDADGHLAGRRDIPGDISISSDVLFDTANNAVWIWDATALALARVDLATLAVDRVTFDPKVDVADGPANIHGARPSWLKPGSPVNRGYAGQMAGAPDGSRLYLLGFGQDSGERGYQPSLGVFVVDTATEALVQHWDPDANYISIQPILGGSIVVAGGVPGADTDGQEAPWEASMTFHDASDGRILLRLGQLGQGYAASVIER